MNKRKGKKGVMIAIFNTTKTFFFLESIKIDVASVNLLMLDLNFPIILGAEAWFFCSEDHNSYVVIFLPCLLHSFKSAWELWDGGNSIYPL